MAAIGAASGRNATAFDAGTRAVEVRATLDCFIRFGDSTVVATATDLFLAASDTRIYSADERLGGR